MVSSWNVLVVDDEEDVHQVTRLALRRRKYREKPFNLTSCYSGAEARTKLQEYGAPQYHVAIIDVVMESDYAGLELVQFVRATFGSSLRIILRTGQPGVAPEEQILEDYDIDHYLAKADATEERLFSSIRSCLRMSEDARALASSNAALTVANAELTRQSGLREALLQKLGGEASLVEALNEAHVALEKDPNSIKQWATILSEMTRGVRDLIKPDDFRSKVEAVLSKHSVLILQGNSKALRFTRTALAGVDATTVVADSWETALENLRTGQVDLLFLDWDNLGIITEAVRYNPNILAVLTTTQEVFETHGETIMQLPISSAVVINTLFGKPSEMDPLLVNELVVTAGKLLSRDIFGLEKYLAWGVKVTEISLDHSSQRADAINEMDKFARTCRVRNTLRQRLATLADELLMNAMWSAPVDGRGQPKYAKRDRREPLQLEPNERVKMRFASDGNRLAISVTDVFGGLARQTAFRYLLKCFARDGARVSHEAGGAGLGISMAYMAMSNFIVNCSPGRKTEVIGILNTQDAVTPQRPRSFHYFCT